jgi:hypothetical protein
MGIAEEKVEVLPAALVVVAVMKEPIGVELAMLVEKEAVPLPSRFAVALPRKRCPVPALASEPSALAKN